jgi:5S rRNA maturation endonuclease (ribonuclease M5)
MNVQDVLAQLRGVRKNGTGWTARCPAHDDNRNSLSVSEGRDEKTLLKCHAGCSYQSIIDAISGLTGANGARRLVVAYDYCDEGGALLYQSVRYEPKDFRQRRPEGAGWNYKLNGVRRVLYRLPELLVSASGERVFIVEGEKDADRLASHNLVATTNAGGAGKWRDDYSECLRGRHVVILPDNDEAGRKHAQQVTHSLHGIAASVRILELPNLSTKGDVSDWLDAGGTVEELYRLVETAPNELPKQTDEAPLQIVRMSDVEPETVRWLWYPYIALGKMTLLEGDPGIGKSTLTCAIASAISNGRGLPETEPCEPANVLMLSAEDGLADTLRPRLDAVGADVSRVLALNQPLTFDTAGMLRFESAIIQYKPILVIIDPLFAYTGGKADIHRANECRAISAPLAAVAERQGCAIVAVRHLGKARGGGHALNAGIGSIDFVAAARSVLLVGTDPDQPSQRAIVQTKNNLAPVGEAIGYTLEGGRFLWTGASTLTAGRILSLPSDEEERGTLAEAKDFLLVALSNGARDSKAIKEEAKQAGISERTLFRAKKELNIKADKVGMPGSHYQKWVWRLPDEECQAETEDCQTSNVGSLRTNETSKDSYGSNLGEGCQVSEYDSLRDSDDIVFPPDMTDEEYKRQYERRK